MKKMKIADKDKFYSPKTRTEENKRALNETIMRHAIESWKDLYDKAVGEENKKRILQLVKLEADGGRCFICGKLWINIKKENMYYILDYYHPGCHCFYRCPLCGRPNHYESEAGILHKKGYKCQCSWKLIDKNIKKHGNKFEKENWDYLNKIRQQKKIYFMNFDGSFVIERIKK